MGRRFYVGTKDEVGDKKIIEVDGEPIIIVKHGDNFYAIHGICPHEMLPMEDGWIEDNFYVCPWHMAKFDISSGKVSDDTPWASDIRTYKVIIEESKIYIEI